MPPENTGITQLPKQCRYIPKTETVSDYFEYSCDGHVLTSSKSGSTNDKFLELINLLERQQCISWENDAKIRWGTISINGGVVLIDPFMNVEDGFKIKNIKHGIYDVIGYYTAHHKLKSLRLYHRNYIRYVNLRNITDISVIGDTILIDSGKFGLYPLNTYKPVEFFMALMSKWVVTNKIIEIDTHGYVKYEDEVTVMCDSHHNKVFCIGIYFDNMEDL